MMWKRNKRCGDMKNSCVIRGGFAKLFCISFSVIHLRCISLIDFMSTSIIKLFPSQCGFYKGYSSQYRLLVMTEKFKESTDKGNAFGALLTDLSKAFDHILLMTNLFAFRILLLSLKLIHSYL